VRALADGHVEVWQTQSSSEQADTRTALVDTDPLPGWPGCRGGVTNAARHCQHA